MSAAGMIYDVAIVGVGAAGLGALWRLGDAPTQTIVALEARNRVGGRAVTHLHNSLPLDMGCGWLHSADRNLLAPLARKRGFTVDETLPDWGRQAGNRGVSPAEQDDFGEAMERLDARLAAAAEAGQEGPASAYFEPGCRWNPLLDAVSSYYNGAEFHAVSVLDYGAYDDSGINWRVREGYGAFLADFATDAIVLGAPVSVIDRSGSALVLETPQGAVRARTAIVTLSTGLIAREALAFHPALPDKVAAAAHLPLGIANKLFLAVDAPDMLPENGHVFGHVDRTETAGYHLRPFGYPVIEAFFGGRTARRLEQAGPQAFVDFAIDELAGVFGSDISRHLTPIESTAWATDPYALGSYSHALPGFAGERAILAAPVDDRLFFAGEACSPHAFSTAHGAFETGIAAAEQALAALSRITG